jgi:signal peptidase I
VRKFSRFLFWTALVVAGVIGFARLVAIRWWRVPDDDPVLEASLAPTLRAGDLVLLWRATAPHYGDLVLCPEPEAPQRVVVGRVLGEQGDHVAIRDSNVVVNGKQSQTERACDRFEVTDPNAGSEVKQQCQIEAVGGHSHMRGSTAGHKVGPQPLDIEEVPDGQVYLVSDNRLFPYDSRDFGPVERSSCKETVVFRVVSRDGYFDQKNRFTFIQ